MTLRVNEIQRVLKPTGSFYLHCDPTASHYLKLVLDAIFLPRGGEFRNEIIWHYLKWSVKQAQFVRNHDVLLFYSKNMSKDRVFNTLYMERSPATQKRFGNAKIISGHDEQGRRKPSTVEQGDSQGVALDDVWDISRVAPIKQLYPTQKPEALLERIILASSNEGDVVMDAYCGCGTTVAVAQRLKRQWIGLDITYQSIALILRRLEAAFGGDVAAAVVLSGVPKDMASAKALALKTDDRTRKEFEKWALLTYSNNRAIINEKKGADGGVDGLAFTRTGSDSNAKVVFQVKSGHVKSGDIDALIGVMAKVGAEMSVFLTLEAPSAPMLKVAAAAGTWEHPVMGKSYPRVQIVTIQAMFEADARLELPMSIEVLKKAAAAKTSEQPMLDMSHDEPEETNDAQ